MDPRGVIAAVRDGRPPDPQAIRDFAHGLATGEVGEGQAAAFAMAVLLRGLGEAGRIALTEGMRDSGDVLGWDLPAPVIDKHSTGGLGDCTSLIIAPMLAACGAVVPMVSGRGLGHTGGTLDKLDAIPGYHAEIEEAAFRRIATEVGCVIAGATGRIAPADRRLYAIRDVTATVESLDLITASILSKKLAAGLEGLVMDVKVGSGAFMKDIGAARALAQSLVDTANGAGCRTVALITAMDQPLAPALGNALEVKVAMEVLTGTSAHFRLEEVTIALGAEALMLGGLASTPAEARRRLRYALTSGHAAERFGAMLSRMGAPPDFIDRWADRLPGAPVQRIIAARTEGVVARMDGEALGLAVVRLGAGRTHVGDRVNPAVGIAEVAAIGTEVSPGDPLAVIHAASDVAADEAERAFRAAVVIDETGEALPLVVEKIG